MQADDARGGGSVRGSIVGEGVGLLFGGTLVILFFVAPVLLLALASRPWESVASLVMVLLFVLPVLLLFGGPGVWLYWGGLCRLRDAYRLRRPVLVLPPGRQLRLGSRTHVGVSMKAPTRRAAWAMGLRAHLVCTERVTFIDTSHEWAPDYVKSIESVLGTVLVARQEVNGRTVEADLVIEVPLDVPASMSLGGPHGDHTGCSLQWELELQEVRQAGRPAVVRFPVTVSPVVDLPSALVGTEDECRGSEAAATATSGVRLLVASETVECGAAVGGRLTWPDDVCGADPLTVVLTYRAEWNGEILRDRTADTYTCRADVSAQFRLTIPDAGPVSYDGQLIQVSWEISALTGGTRAVVPVRVVPRGWSHTRSAPPTA